MKILFIIFVSAFGLLLGGCATDESLMSDEEYRARKGPAPHSPNFAPTNY
jgi:hypothetical protein